MESSGRAKLSQLFFTFVKVRKTKSSFSLAKEGGEEAFDEDKYEDNVCIPSLCFPDRIFSSKFADNISLVGMSWQ